MGRVRARRPGRRVRRRVDPWFPRRSGASFSPERTVGSLREESRMTLLRSHVQGGWHTGTGAGRPVYDAVTGDEVARLSTDGLDAGAALAYGRTVGGPALRALTFHQRAALLKALGGHLREHREELYAVSARTGATLGDSKFDVDGGIGVLLAYASKAKRELPNDTVYVDGDVEPLGKGGTFLGQHVCTPRRGVAVQVNAFNFPVWGPLEKLAPAFLAGVPSARETGQPDRVPHREAGRADRRLRPAARRRAAVRRGRPRGHVRPPHRPGPGELHRLRVDGTDVAHAPGDRPELGALLRRGGLAELLRARPGRRSRHARVRPVREGPGHRDDGEGRAEVHRDPPRVRAVAARRRRRRGRVRALEQGRRRSAGRRGRADGRAGEPGPARGGPAQREGTARRRADRVRRPGHRRGRRCRRGPRRVRLAAAAGRGPASGRSRTRSRRSARSRR